MDGTNIDGRSWETSGPYHYQRDAHPSFTVRSGHLIVASVFCSDGIEAGYRRARLIAAAPELLASLVEWGGYVRGIANRNADDAGIQRIYRGWQSALLSAGYEVK